MDASRKISLQQRITLVTIVPLAMIVLTLSVLLVRSTERLGVIRDFTEAVSYLPHAAPLRTRVSAGYDALVLGDLNRARAALAALAGEPERIRRLNEITELGHFDWYRAKVAEFARNAVQIMQRGLQELEQQGAASDATLERFDHLLEAYFIAIWQANASYHVEKLPVENAKYAFLLMEDLQGLLESNRRLVIKVLHDRQMSEPTRHRLHANLERIDLLLSRYLALRTHIDWPRVADYIGVTGEIAQGYLRQPLLARLRTQASGAAATEPAGDAPLLPGAGEWYASQQSFWQHLGSERDRVLADGEQVAARILGLELLSGAGLLMGLLLAIGLVLVTSHRFRREILRQVQDLESALEHIGASGELDRRLPETPIEEFSRVFVSVNGLLEALEADERHIRDLLRRSQESEDRLNIQAREIQQTNDALQRQAEALAEANDAIQAHAVELAQASTYKSQFLANMSHELRTPLNSMLLLSRELTENRYQSLSEEDLECARIIHESGQNLLALINDILDLSKIEAGKVELHLQGVALPTLLDPLYRRYRPLALEKGLDFHFELAPDLPDLITTDHTRLQQVITNLISNALKFTERGEIRLRVERRTVRAGREEMLVVLVKDTGIGIAADKLDKIFNLFEQADSSTTRNYGGTGLGLALSRQLTELMGGMLTVESQPGKGTTFTVMLPLVQETGNTAAIETHVPDPATPTAGEKETAPAPNIPQQADPILKGRTILLVDQDMRNVYALARALTALGMEVLKAGSTDRCRELLHARGDRIDVICMDIPHSDRGAMEALEDLCGDPGRNQPPLVAMASGDADGHRTACLQAGAKAFVSKPCDLDKLIDALHSCLGTDVTEERSGARH